MNFIKVSCLIAQAQCLTIGETITRNKSQFLVLQLWNAEIIITIIKIIMIVQVYFLKKMASVLQNHVVNWSHSALQYRVLMLRPHTPVV